MISFGLFLSFCFFSTFLFERFSSLIVFMHPNHSLRVSRRIKRGIEGEDRSPVGSGTVHQGASGGPASPMLTTAGPGTKDSR